MTSRRPGSRTRATSRCSSGSRRTSGGWSPPGCATAGSELGPTGRPDRETSHVRFRQPCGLEGLLRVRVEPGVGDLAVLESVEGAEAQFDGRAAGLAGPPLSRERDDAVISDVEDLLELE